MLKIHETTTPGGAVETTFLRVDDGALSLSSGEGTVALPDGALDAVMRRYGMPVDPEAQLTVVASLELGDGRVLRHARHLARYDVIARDWLVYDAPGQETACALATTVAGALDHLARAGRRA
ncbi:MAG: hypothetical protein KF764_22860 [Labilithrix sp.]|nr:hypothetical protein [Labilithrix sp.]MBX3223794.1 hypothetical protein [Labilithrix sp.]